MEEVINYYERVLDGLRTEQCQIFLDEIKSRVRDCDIALTSEVLRPLDDKNELSEEVKNNIVREHIKKEAFIELLEFFNVEKIKESLVQERAKLNDPSVDLNELY